MNADAAVIMSPLTVELSWVDEIYPAVPRPTMLDWMGAPKVCPLIVLTFRACVDTVWAWTVVAEM